MAVAKIDPKVIFASEAPVQDTPAVFTNKTVGWGESRKNGGRPTIKQSNALQQETDLKILWLNENSVTPFDATIDYPENAVTIKDGLFKILESGSWELFLDKSSVGLSNVDNTSDLNKPVSTTTQTALNLKADKSTTYTKVEVDSLINSSIPDEIVNSIGGESGAITIEALGLKLDERGYPAGSVQYGEITQERFNDGLESIAEMLAIINPKDGTRLYVNSFHENINKGGDWFKFRASRQLENDGGNIINGWERQVAPNYLNFENYGATGIGADDYTDQTAIEKIRDVIKNSSERAFIVHIPFGNYTQGRQSWEAGVGFTNSGGLDVEFDELTDKYIYLKSEGATITARSGMHYGVFDKNTKEPFATTMPFYPGTPSWEVDKDRVTIAELGRMINFGNVKGVVTEGVLNLIGGREDIVLGGQYGDVGWQLQDYGFRVARVEKINISNIHARNSCLDGIYVAGYNSLTEPNIHNSEYYGIIRNCTSFGNGRQACSFTGGQNISWYDCVFDKTAMPDFNIQSAPKSCFDIEAEISSIRNSNFYNCYFGDSPNTSMVADTGDIEDVQFHNCKFVNSIGSVSWVRKPKFKFNYCYFNGFMEGQYLATLPEDRTIYNKCTFTDDPSINPSMVKTNSYLIDVAFANPVFNDCTMDIYRSGLMYSIGAPADELPQFNNLIINLFGTNGECAMHGLHTTRIRDYRPIKNVIFLSMYGTGNIAVELMDEGVPKIGVVNFDGKIHAHEEIQPISTVYNPRGIAVENATGVDDTALKLNALIASLKDAGKIS